uniref:Uncharacterized protein n=1 Tax=Anguilla anguilla TaxID=7936 RepID=A0A0E9W044_ANGAN
MIPASVLVVNINIFIIFYLKQLKKSNT